ncbi:MAG TPA: molybdenum ABC transporter ATP-binding protein [Gammaproteobacteria bacterium]|nr:molybdenum ABC transporter ATP-binding protein [Gammaproteobacteria bacterium]
MNGLDASFRLARADFELVADLTIPARGVTALFGPSGSGKTTLLRCLAGLEPEARGHLRLDAEVWQDDARSVFIAPHRRALGYVFQDTRLFPHLNVRANLDYGRRRAHPIDTRHSQQERFEHIVELLGLSGLLERYPAQLSGGEQQRAAIGRALLTQPRLLLMDEPLAALDAARKRDILPYLDELRRALDIPVVYVTHAIDEVSRLADHLVLIESGRVQASGDLMPLLSRLEYPLAHGEGAMTLIEARIAGHDDAYHLSELAFAGGSLTVSRQPGALGDRVRVAVHARDVSITLAPTSQSSILNVLPATVAEISQEDPARVTVRLRLLRKGRKGAADAGSEEDVFLLARITRKSCERLALAPGREVYAQVKSVALVG